MTERARRGASRRAAHPLLGVFPLTVMTLATFLVVFALLMARLELGADPALHVGPVATLGANAARPGSTVTTRASGGTQPVAPATSEVAPGGSPAVVTTRTSGGALAGESRDD